MVRHTAPILDTANTDNSVVGKAGIVAVQWHQGADVEAADTLEEVEDTPEEEAEVEDTCSLQYLVQVAAGSQQGT